jgi:hypothetical protein
VIENRVECSSEQFGKEMKLSSFVIVVVLVLSSDVSGSYEQFDEKAWMDSSSRNKYFDYSDVIIQPGPEPQNQSGNIDVIEFVETKTIRVSWEQRR